MRQFWKFGSILAVLALLVVMGLNTQGSVQAQTSGTLTLTASSNLAAVTGEAAAVSSTSVCSRGCTATDAMFTILASSTDSDATVEIRNLDSESVRDKITSAGAAVETADPTDIDGSDANPKVYLASAFASAVSVRAVHKSSGLKDDRDVRTGRNQVGSPDDSADNTAHVIEVKAFHGNRIQVTLKQSGQLGISRILTVDNQDPSVLVNSPDADLVVKRAVNIAFSANVTDSNAGFKSKAADVLASNNQERQTAVSSAKGRIELYLGQTPVSLAESNLSSITDGWRVTKSLSSSDVEGLGQKVPWYFVAEDLAGNVKESAGSITGKASTAGLAAGTTVVSEDFANAGYQDDVFNGRRIKITTTATSADVTTTGGIYDAPADVNHDSATDTDGTATTNVTFTPNTGAKWSVGTVTHTKAIDDFSNSDGTFTLAAGDAFMADLSLLGMISGDLDNDPATGNHGGTAGNDTPRAYTFTKKVAIAIPKGASFEILNTRLITVDGTPPALGTPNAVTGHAWGGSPAKHLTGTKAKKDSIQITFIDAGGLDTATVTASAFQVSGNTVESVLVVDTAGKSLAATETKAANSFLVFLTLGTDLGSSAKPAITIASGVIRDRAGNAYGGDTIRAVDRLGPNLSLDKDKALSNEKVKITISSDEQLGAAPQLWVTKVTTNAGAAERDTEPNVSASPVTALSYSYTADVGNLGRGEYNVYAEGSDTQNQNNKGAAGNSSAANTASSFTFELDDQLNGGDDPVVSVSDKKAVYGSATQPEVESVDPMIVTVDFKDETGEYTRDSYRTVTLTSASLKVSFADGTSTTNALDLTTDVSSPDNIQFTIPLLNPKVGSYELTVKAMDEAGNNRKDGSGTAQSLTSKWKVVAPKPVNIPLSPGWNLISLPFQPANPAINSVIPANHPARIVMTYDNLSQVWMVSRRDAETGLFTGDITVLTANTAYFIQTEKFLPLALLRPALATAAAAPPPPPAITVVKGWNLVPIVSNDIPTPAGIAADDYFGTLKSGSGSGWLKALTFNTLNRTWISVTPGATEVVNHGGTNPCTGRAVGTDADKSANDKVEGNAEPCQALAFIDKSDPKDAVFNDGDSVTLKKAVTVGKGYWLYSTVDGVIIP